MARALMIYETIDKIQIDAIMEGKDPPPPKDWPGPNGTSSVKEDDVSQGGDTSGQSATPFSGPLGDH